LYGPQHVEQAAHHAAQSGKLGCSHLNLQRKLRWEQGGRSSQAFHVQENMWGEGLSINELLIKLYQKIKFMTIKVINIYTCLQPICQFLLNMNSQFDQFYLRRQEFLDSFVHHETINVIIIYETASEMILTMIYYSIKFILEIANG